MMRVTFTQINDNVQRNLASNYAQLAKLQEQLSSGRRLNRPSDDPIDMKNNVNLKAELAQGTQYHRNIEDGLAWMNMTEVALTDMNELMQRLREQAVYAGNDTMTGTDRQYIAAEVEQLLRQVVSLTNSSYKGNFLFGGTNGDKQVYEYTTGNTTSTSGSIPIQYQWSLTLRAREHAQSKARISLLIMPMEPLPPLQAASSILLLRRRLLRLWRSPSVTITR